MTHVHVEVGKNTKTAVAKTHKYGICSFEYNEKLSTVNGLSTEILKFYFSIIKGKSLELTHYSVSSFYYLQNEFWR